MYCFDTDVLSALLRRDPPLELIRRMATVRPEDQATTAITMGELVYGASKRGSPDLTARVEELLLHAGEIIAFDAASAAIYGGLRASLETGGRRLAEPDLRIASIVLSRDLTLVTGNVKHFQRVPGLRVENWLAE